MDSAAIIWTRQFVAERWPDPITPLSASLLFEAFVGEFLTSDYFARRICDDTPPVTIINGYPYLNATMFISLMSRLGIPTPTFIAELYPPALRKQDQEKRFRLPDPKAYLILFRTLFSKRFWRLIDLDPLHNHQHWERFVPKYLADIAALQSAEADTIPLPALMIRFQACIDLLWCYRRLHLGSLALGNFLYQLLGWLMDRWISPIEVVKRGHLVAGLPGSHTLETNRALWKLAVLVSRHPTHRQRFLESTPEEVAAWLATAPSDEVVDEFNAFLRMYGHRTINSYELASPTWKKDPRYLVGLVHDYLESDGYPRALRNEEETIAVRQAVTSRLDQVLGTGLTNRLLPYRRYLFRQLLQLSQKYMLLRENQRFVFDYNLEALKHFCAAIGTRLTKAGALSDPGNVYFLTHQELLAVLRGEMNGTATLRLADGRRDLHDEYKRRTPPVYLQGDIPLTPITGGDIGQITMLSGTGVSSGRVTGRARIVTDPRGIERLQEDEILVAVGTDPGWTPLFITALGAIMEIGGMLSHGSVVAREYGLPAVVGIVGATKILHNGQVITLDGDNGVVYI
ncbi:hypothetical protein JW905_08085 [bacterium]|nr:hypothetical protein [candidate division CSSED10-310 bacterium]